jgi:hypothetical protein
MLKIENATMFLFSLFDFEWWWFPILILTPDISMLGYIFNPKIGAITYNIFHHKGIALLLYLIGIYMNNEIITLTGIILFGHASLDRIFGYGLKYEDSFIHTHLGMLKKVKTE